MTALAAAAVSAKLTMGRIVVGAGRLGPAVVQPRSLTVAEQRGRATRPDLWPTFAPPPAVPLADVDDDGLDDLDW